MNSSSPARGRGRLFFSTLATGFFVLLAVLSFGLWCTYHEIKLRRDLDEATAQHTFDMMEYSMASIYRTLSSDLTALTSLSSLHLWLQNPSEQGLQLLIHDWSSLLRSFARYQRLYFVDEKGQAVTILRYNYPTDSLILRTPEAEVPPRLLTQATNLSAHEILQEPLPPMTSGTNNFPSFEEAAAVFDSQGRRRGTLIMTYDAGEMLRLFQRVDRGFSYFLSVLNDKGVPVYCRNTTDTSWGLDDSSTRPKGCTLPPLGGETWKTINDRRVGTFYDHRGLNYHFKASIPGFRAGSQAMTMIFISCYPSTLPGYEAESLFMTVLLAFFQRQWFVVVALVLLVISLAFLLTRRRAKSLSL